MADQPEPPATVELRQTWGPKLRSTREAMETANLVHEQTIRDAYAAGMKVSWIRNELGIKNRNKITEVLRSDSPDVDTDAIQAPALPVHIYLRAPGHGESFWTRTITAMHARGWRVIRNDQEAWYLSRANATMVHVDVSAVLDSDPITVALMQAVEAQPAEQESYPVSDLLPVTASILLERAFPGAADLHVPVQTVERRWKRLAGGEKPRPRTWAADATNNLGQPGAFQLDEQVICRWVADLL